MAGTCTVGVIPSIELPATLRICCMCHSGSANPSRPFASNVTSERIACRRSFISCEKPAMTLLTTIIVATPSVTLTIEARAMYLVLRYRQQSRNLYMTHPWDRLIQFKRQLTTKALRHGEKHGEGRRFDFRGCGEEFHL